MRTQINLIKSKGLFYLTSLGLLAAIVLSLVTPGIALAANPIEGPLAGSYIIVFRDSVNPKTAVPDFAKAFGLQTGFIYEHALKGMSAVIPPGRLAALQKDPRVAYIVEDMERSISAQEIPTGIQRIFADGNSNIRINGVDDWRVDVDVAVIDTGIDFQHPDLNVVGGVNCSGGWPWNKTCKSGGDDDHYHGTHVAGTIGALDNGDGVVGVAPGARLWAVKVLNSRGSGYSSWIIAGIDWVTANAATIEVANMSLGGSGFNQAEYDAIQGAVNAGIAFAVAAGNDDSDAINYSPGGFDNVLSVSALADFDGKPGALGSPTCRTDQDDTLADFSNWGSAVDIAAPGVCILSTYPLEKGEYGTISGTSMASPHVAGALALLASRNNPGNATDVYNLYNQVKNAGNNNWTDDSGDGIQEPLLDVSNTTIFNPIIVPGSGGGGGNTAPSVTISSPADGGSYDSGASISFAGTATDAEDGDLTSSLVWTSNIDGQIGTGSTFNKMLTVGTHTITAAVTDSGSLTGSDSVTIVVEESVVENKPPTADFDYSISGLTVTFTDKSTDSDGTVVGWNWNFGDGNTSTAQNPYHIYTVAGTYNVSLTVTDDDGATGSTSQSITVSSSTTLPITVTSLIGSKTIVNRNFWKATVTITVNDSLSGAVVSGSWSTGGTGTCTTDGAGQCAISSANLRTNVSSTTFTLTGVALTGYHYVAPTVTTVIISKP